MLQDFMEFAEPTPTFLLGSNITPIQNNKMQAQAALHSALFNYTPLVIRRTDKNKQLTIVKPTQTGINRNK
jgi:hypothetical protein